MIDKDGYQEAADWAQSWASELLYKDTVNGNIPNDMPWQEAYQQRPEFVLSVRRRFSARLESLRQSIKKSRGRADIDAAALDHDRKIHPVPAKNYRGESRWEGSRAELLLKQDVTKAKENNKKIHPIALYEAEDCPEYWAYPLTIFRLHIYQEQRFQKYCTWRNDVTEKIEMKQKKVVDNALKNI